MSIEVMTRVWKGSKQKGSRLLLLLAIADHADEMGFAWPGISLLAEKLRMSERQTKRLLAETEATGELYIDRRGYNNRYIVTVGMSDERILAVLTDRHRLAHHHEEALKISTDIKARQQQKHGDKLSPCYVKSGDIQGKHGDKSGQQGDMDVTLIINESSIESSINQDDEEGVTERIFAAVVALYEQEIGSLTAMVVDELHELIDVEQNLDRWRTVFKQSVGKVHRWAWVRKVITNPLPKAPPEKAGTGKRSAMNGRPATPPARRVERTQIQELIKSRNAGAGGGS
jgi:hypothetical protein